MQKAPKFKNCITYPKDCYLCSKGQQKFCEIPNIEPEKITQKSLLSETNGEDYV